MPYAEGNHGEGVDVEADVHEDHVGKGEEVRHDERDGEDDPRQKGPVCDGAMNEDDEEDEEEDGIVPLCDDLVGRGQDAAQTSRGLGNGVFHELGLFLMNSFTRSITSSRVFPS